MLVKCGNFLSFQIFNTRFDFFLWTWPVRSAGISLRLNRSGWKCNLWKCDCWDSYLFNTVLKKKWMKIFSVCPSSVKVVRAGLRSQSAMAGLKEKKKVASNAEKKEKHLCVLRKVNCKLFYLFLASEASIFVREWGWFTSTKNASLTENRTHCKSFDLFAPSPPQISFALR